MTYWRKFSRNVTIGRNPASINSIILSFHQFRYGRIGSERFCFLSCLLLHLPIAVNANFLPSFFSSSSHRKRVTPEQRTGLIFVADLGSRRLRRRLRQLARIRMGVNSLAKTARWRLDLYGRFPRFGVRGLFPLLDPNLPVKSESLFLTDVR